MENLYKWFFNYFFYNEISGNWMSIYVLIFGILVCMIPIISVIVFIQKSDCSRPTFLYLSIVLCAIFIGATNIAKVMNPLSDFIDSYKTCVETQRTFVVMNNSYMVVIKKCHWKKIGSFELSDKFFENERISRLEP